MQQYANNPAIQLHGPGWSKIIIGEDQIENWRDYVDVMRRAFRKTAAVVHQCQRHRRAEVRGGDRRRARAEARSDRANAKRRSERAVERLCECEDGEFIDAQIEDD